MEEPYKYTGVDKLISTGYSISQWDYELNYPVVNENLEEINVTEDLVKLLSVEENKVLKIIVDREEMIPSAVMFGMKTHMFIQKIVVLHTKIPGWKLVLSFLLSSHINNIILES